MHWSEGCGQALIGVKGVAKHWSEGCGHAFEALNSVKVFVADTKTTLALNLVLLGVTTITKHQNGVIITTKIKTVQNVTLVSTHTPLNSVKGVAMHTEILILLLCSHYAMQFSFSC
jgi:hypothetical protein